MKTDWQDVSRDLDTIVSLSENWDGEGASPVDGASFDCCTRMLQRIKDKGCPAPLAVYLLATGTVMAEWHRDDRTQISAEFRDGYAECLLWKPDAEPRFSRIEVGG